MRKNLKVISLILGLVFLVGTFFGCSSKKPAEDSGSNALIGTVEVYYWKSGIPITFLKKLKEAFESKHEDIVINLDNESADANVFFNTIDQGASINTIDLYIGTMGAFWNRTEYLEPLDEILNYTVEGESKSIGEKISTVSYKSDNNKTYALPWQESVTGLVYNEEMFRENGWKIPRTTNELISLAETIVSANLKNDGDTVTPFIHFANGYWKYLLEPWWGQYDGVDQYNNFWSAKYVKEDGTIEQPSNMVWKQQGRLEALKVLKELISADGRVYPESNSMRNTDAQTLFVNGKAAMMANGAWLETETKTDLPNFKMMRTPVLSSLGTKLGISEAQLCETIDFVDGESQTAPVGVSQDVIEQIRIARSVTFTEAGNFHVVVPKYSDVKGATKEFLKFMYSDEGIRIMAENINSMPAAKLSTGEDVDISGWSEFAKKNYALQKNAKFIYKRMNYSLFYMTDLEEAWATQPASIFSNSNPSSRMSAEELFNLYYNNMTGSRWQKYLIQAGLD